MSEEVGLNSALTHKVHPEEEEQARITEPVITDIEEPLIVQDKEGETHEGAEPVLLNEGTRVAGWKKYLFFLTLRLVAGSPFYITLVSSGIIAIRFKGHGIFFILAIPISFAGLTAKFAYRALHAMGLCIRGKLITCFFFVIAALGIAAWQAMYSTVHRFSKRPSNNHSRLFPSSCVLRNRDAIWKRAQLSRR